MTSGPDQFKNFLTRQQAKRELGDVPATKRPSFLDDLQFSELEGIPETEPFRRPDREQFPGAFGNDPDRLGLLLEEDENERNFRLEKELAQRGLPRPIPLPIGASLKEINDQLNVFLRGRPDEPQGPGGVGLGRGLLNIAEFAGEPGKESAALARTLIPSELSFKMPPIPGLSNVPTESVIFETPSAFQSTEKRAAELRAEGKSDLEAAFQAAAEDPLPTIQVINPLATLAAMGTARPETPGVPKEDLFFDVAAPQFLLEMSVDYLNALALLGPGIKTARISLEFAEFAMRSGLKNAGESLEAFAKRLPTLLKDETGSFTPGEFLPRNLWTESNTDWRLRHLATPQKPVPVTRASTMTPESSDEIIEWWSSFIASPESISSRAYTETLKKQWQAEKATRATIAVNEALAQGASAEEVSRILFDSLRGKFDAPTTGIEALVTEQVTDALTQRVQLVLKDEPFEMASTLAALSNALAGKTIPSAPGTAGGSALSRLQRVFPQNIVDALTSKTPIELQIAKGMRGAPEHFKSAFPEGIPPSVPFGQARLGEEPFELRGVNDPRTPLQKRLAMMPLERAAGRGPKFPESAFPEGIPPSTPRVQGRLGEPAVDPAELQLAREQGDFGGPIPGEVPEPKQFPADPRSALEKQTSMNALLRAVGRESPIPDPTGTALRDLDNLAGNQIHLMPPADRNLIIQTLKAAGLTLMDIGHFFRANLASTDFSWLRQQALLISGNLNSFGPAVAKSLRSAWSAEYANLVMKTIENSKLYDVYQGLDLDFLRPLPGEVSAQWRAAEDLMALAVVKGETPRFFQRLAERTPWIRVSARAHVIGTNAMNWRIWEKHYEYMLRISERIGRGDIVLKGEKVFDINKEMELFGKMLADMSARGPLKGTVGGKTIDLTSLSPAMNSGFFSMRALIGRAVTPRHFYSSSKYVRRAMWKNLMATIAMGSGVVLAGKQMGLWDADTDFISERVSAALRRGDFQEAAAAVSEGDVLDSDRLSADFMKIRVGKTRVDIWGGAQQWFVLYNRLLQVSPSIKSTETGQVEPSDPTGVGGRFLMSKIHPALGFALETWLEKDFKGSKVEREDWRRWLKNAGPLALLDIYEAMDGEGLMGIIPGATGIIGAGVQTYDLPRWEELDPYYEIQANNNAVNADALKKKFREEPLDAEGKPTFENEAKLFVRGHIKSLTGGGLAAQRVQEIMLEEKVTPKDVPGYANVFGTNAWPPPRLRESLGLPPLTPAEIEAIGQEMIEIRRRQLGIQP